VVCGPEVRFLGGAADDPKADLPARGDCDREIGLGPFGGGAETWLRLQMAYDLVQARQHEAKIKVKRVVRPRVEASRPLK